jgi:hypothetical protein
VVRRPSSPQLGEVRRIYAQWVAAGHETARCQLNKMVVAPTDMRSREVTDEMQPGDKVALVDRAVYLLEGKGKAEIPPRQISNLGAETTCV